MQSPNRPRVKEAVERFVARVRHNIDVHLETLSADLVRALEEEGGKVSVDRLSDLARAASSIQTQEGKLDALAKLVGALRMQDDATTLKGILDALARGASGEASRVAVLLVDGDTLRSFGDYGYTSGARPADVPVGSFSALARVVADRQRLSLVSTPGAQTARRSGVHARDVRQFRHGGPRDRGGRRRRADLRGRPGANARPARDVAVAGTDRDSRPPRVVSPRERHVAADG